MAGLMNPGAVPPPQPATGQAPQQPQPATPSTAPDEESSNVSPEEQAQYDKFMNNALEIIYPHGEQAQVSPQIIDDLSGKIDDETQQTFAQAQPPIQQNPIDNLAVTAVSLVLMLESSAEQAGAQIEDDVVFHAGKDIVEELGEVAGAANIHDYDEKQLEGAFYRALDLYRISSPRADQASLAQGFQQIQQADQDGSLSQLLPGIDQAAR